MEREFELSHAIANSRREIEQAQELLQPKAVVVGSNVTPFASSAPIRDIADRLSRALQQLEGAESLLQQHTMLIEHKQQALADEKNLLKAVADTFSEQVYIKDLQHRYTFGNSAQVIGHDVGSVENLIGKTDQDLYPAELAQELMADDDRVIQSGIPIIDKVMQFSGREGGFEWSSTTKAPLRNLKGETTGIIGITRDVSSQVYIEQAIQDTVIEIYDLYNHAPCGYHSLDENGVFIQINDVELDWLGYTKEDVLGKLRFDDVLTPEGKMTFSVRFSEFKRTGVVKDAEFDLLCKDGSVRTVLLNSTVVRDEHDNYVMSRSTLHDVTKLKRVEMDLRESEEKFRLIIEAAPLPVIITDHTGQITLINEQAEELFGYSPDELDGQLVEVLVPEASRGEHVDNRQEYLTNIRHTAHDVVERELVARHKSGRTFPVEIELSYIETHNGKLVISFVVDITERRERERQLLFNASLQENVTDAVIATDKEFRIQSWNRAAERTYGWRADEVLGQSYEAILQTQFGFSETFERFQNELFVSGRWQREITQRHKDGSEVYVLSSFNVFNDEHGAPLGIVAIHHDVTERKKAEEILQVKIENELEFQIYLKALHDITIELTAVDKVDDFYRRAVELALEHLGFDRFALFLYDKDADLVVGTYGTSPDGKLADERSMRFHLGIDTAMYRAFQTAERFCFDENADLYDDGVVIGRGWNAAAALWDGTQCIGWLVADNYIHRQPASKAILDTLALYAMTVSTQLIRKQTDAALRESEARYRLLAENISDVIVRLGPTGDILYVSPSCHSMLGYLPEEMIGKSALLFVEAEALEDVGQRIAHAVDGGAPVEALVVVFRHKQGHNIWIEATGQVITSPDGLVQEFIASLRDISERKRAEEAIQQSLAREKELGELKSRFVSMASHELRTPLANILAMTETIDTYRKKMTDEQISVRLNAISGQIGHLNDIIDDVLKLARMQARRIDFEPHAEDFDALCREIVAEFDVRPDVMQDLVYQSKHVPGPIQLDKKLMRQVINNLISNAVKYSGAGKAVKINLGADNEWCELSVSDEGIGIPETDLKRVFEPFHRANNVGTISGTGLGLSISREAVELHGGTLTVESTVNIGTTVRVKIPLQTQMTKG